MVYSRRERKIIHEKKSSFFICSGFNLALSHWCRSASVSLLPAAFKNIYNNISMLHRWKPFEYSIV